MFVKRKRAIPVVFFIILTCFICKAIIDKIRDYQIVAFNFPLFNVSNIVQEIELKGATNVAVINHKPERLHIKSDIIDKNELLPHSEQQLLILVKSYVGNFDQRLAIRHTWGRISGSSIKVPLGATREKSGSRIKKQLRITKDIYMYVIFIVGYQYYVESLVQEETKMFKDIIQGNFEDIYDNNILKTFLTYQWIAQNYKNVKYVLLVDDDYLVNVKNIVHFIETQDNFSNKDIMYGYKIQWAQPFRSRRSKWYVSREEYSPFFWPPYLIGGAILTNFKVIKKIYLAFPYVRYVHIDDAYIGIVARHVDIILKHEKRFSADYVEPEKMRHNFASHLYGERGALIHGWKTFVSL